MRANHHASVMTTVTRHRKCTFNGQESQWLLRSEKSMEDTSMFNLLCSATRKSLIPFVLLCGLTAGQRAFGQVAPNGYWDNYWNWYNGTYRPYYQRRQSFGYVRGGYAAPGYFNTYGNPNGMSPYPSGHIYTAPSGPTLNSGLFPQTTPPATTSPSPYGWW
jgi:hypothetical protein